MDRSLSDDKIQSGLLGLEQLHKLACWEELRAEYDVELPKVHHLYQEAIEDGEIWNFVRWTTHKLLYFSASSEVREAKTTHFILEAMKGTVTELQNATIVEHAWIQDKELLQAEVGRFRELGSLLQQCFDLLCDSLSSKPGSRLETRALVVATREIDIAGGLAVHKVRSHGALLHDPASARIVSSAILEQLNEWHHPLRLEIALGTMLEALPKLEDAVFWKINVDAWGPILVRHGMEDDATRLAAAVNERRTAAVGLSSAKPTASSLPQDSSALPQDSVLRSKQSDPTPRAKFPNASKVKKSKNKANVNNFDFGAIGFFDATSDYSRTSMTPDSTPVPGTTSSQLFNPTQRRPVTAITAGSRRRFEGRLMGGDPVATPGTAASSRSSLAAPTPTLRGPSAPRKVGKGRSRAKIQETIDEEASEDEENDEEDRGNEAISVAESWNSEGSSEQDVDGDSEMGGSSE